MRQIIIVISFCLFAVVNCYGQSLYSLNTQWDDELKDWVISADEGEVEGEIEMTWRMRNDMTEWRFRMGEVSGSIKQKWDNNPNLWELRSGSKVISIATIYSGSFDSFRISDGQNELKVERTLFNSDPIEWRLMHTDEDLFFWYNEYEHDIRDWVIEDHLPDTISFEMKLAAVFVSILHSI